METSVHKNTFQSHWRDEDPLALDVPPIDVRCRLPSASTSGTPSCPRSH